MEGTSDPDYTECVDIATKGALREMIIPGVWRWVLLLLLDFLE
ncbi:MAG: hypothetical protein CM1200mP22_13070 [Dehalococcoidia bacterium]|nr:MAG: hypothetical protein CM1200mP22_13070 [Dehalococcoidia bacterium]